MKYAYLALLGVATATVCHAASNDPFVTQAANGAIKFRDYPVRALSAREQGSVAFRVRTDSNGNTLSCQVTRTSGYPLLDQDTCRLLSLYAVFQAPKAAPGTVISQDGVVSWTLPQPVEQVVAARLSHSRETALDVGRSTGVGAAPANALPTNVATTSFVPAPKPAVAPTPKWNRGPSVKPAAITEAKSAQGEKLVCKRVPRTGSLAGFEKVCRTKVNWDRSDEASGGFSEMQGRMGSTHGN